MYTASSDPNLLDVPLIHEYLSQQSYWGLGMPLETLERAIANSLNFGLYGPDGRQAAFARVVTDRATFAWLCDVFVLPEFQGQSLGKQLMQTVFAHPDLQDLRRFLLATLDAHSLYRRFGFQDLAAPDRYLEIKKANPYGVPTGN
ncbi:GNAT family N-acetyltransferase [Hymenobacter psychrophilus]|uniref:N-acetylglutamate synthase, GNAT family n=1 Tax=Hymenobacter psychrophilus TaxID=651662 RepID=A0A1H3ELR4_9BACT|nr:GNAT family N-acetyltransferase [Hymenobacter psychrophilus]SDX79535.1 N-acetylglutamate synthase, GNAT family [Hymenobacter psychrophilus]